MILSTSFTFNSKLSNKGILSLSQVSINGLKTSSCSAVSCAYSCLDLKVKNIDDIKNTVEQIKKIDNVNTVSYGEEMVEQLITVFDVINKISIGAVIALVVVTAFLITNTIKLAIYARKREIEIMRLVGASNISIKVPFVIEGLFLGFLGSIIPVIITIYGYTSLYDFFGGKLFGSSLIRLIEPTPFVYLASLLLIIIGILVGMFGSWQAVKKYLKI